MAETDKPIAFSQQVAAEIKRRREKRRMLVCEAADLAGVNVQTWYHWEAAYALPLDRLPAIAAALRCKPRDLLPK